MEISPFAQWGAAGLLAVIVLVLVRQISTGAWVPRREMDYVRADRDARLAEKDEQIVREHATAAEWRAAHETSEAARELLVEQVRTLATAVDGGNKFYDAFQAAIARWELSGSGPGSRD